jgi:hypothetical protein
MSKISKFVAVLAALPVLTFAAPVFAASAGQLGGGDNYVAKNLTKGGAYGDNTAAACNETVQYSMQLTNTQFGALNNVTLKASLPSQGGVSTATATTDLGGTTGTSDTTTVTLGSGVSQSLVSGTTVLYDDAGHSIKTLSDTVNTTGVNIGTLNGSTTEYVNFQVKMTCETVQPKDIQVCRLSDKQVITIKETEFDAAKHTKDLSQCKTTTTPPVTPPTTLAKTGPTDTVAIVAAAIAAGTVGARLFLSRRLTRQ